MSTPSNASQAYLPTTLILPSTTDSEKFTYVLTDFIKKIIQAVNDKEISYYVLTETLTGQKYFEPDNNNRFRQIYRKVVDFGALPNTATKSIPHGIDTTPTTQFTAIYGVANELGADAIPISNLEVHVTPTEIAITTSSDLSDYLNTTVVLEYIK